MRSDVLRTEFNRSVATIRESIGERGTMATAGEVAAVAGGQLAFPVIRARRRSERFQFRGQSLPYTLARYNNSFRNERSVEISIAKWFVGDSPGRFLEVGNVLSHYGISGHTILDKYENIEDVINEDVVDYVTDDPFDTVVAVSTLEHVGWDETPRDPSKVVRAFQAVQACVRPGGRLLISVPLGYNDGLDAALRSGEIALPEEAWLRRMTRGNQWAECGRDEALSTRYGQQFRNANSIYVGMIL